MAEQRQPQTSEPQASTSPMPFADLAKNVAELYPGKLMEHLAKTIGHYPLAGINIDTLLESNRKNIEALGAANRLIFENAETVMRRQGEMLRQTLEEASVTLKAFSKADTPQDLAMKQGELFRQIFLRALENMREVANMMTQSSSQALEAINERVRDNVEEIKARQEKPTSPQA